MRSASEILSQFQSWNIAADSRKYLEFHAHRYEFLLARLHEVLDDPYAAVTVLDVGPSFQTLLLRECFPGAIVNTLGFKDERFLPRDHERHFTFDLNESQRPESWPDVEPHDVIVMAEVIEHLYTSPRRVLECIGNCLKPGGTLVLQTPNPVSLWKRLRMLMGESPFEVVREERNNPGHFCEYTVAQLRELANQAGLAAEGVWLSNYFQRSPSVKWLYDLCCSALPGKLHDGITMTFRKREELTPPL